ncbi:MAG: hypothetical protein AAGM27_07750 [Cyanobacteria bacterium J06554_3]
MTDSIDPAMAAAILYLTGEGAAPDPKSVVVAMQQLERQRKQPRPAYAYAQLVGTWRLGFVSGTQKSRPRPGAKPVTQLGSGRFLPGFVTVQITYGPLLSDRELSDLKTAELAVIADVPEAMTKIGSVKNEVILGPVRLQLSGPTRFWSKTNSLAFDFTRLKAQVSELTLYQGSIRNGEKRDQAFATQALKDQAFFTFFCVEPDYIAARGKGGGLALWVRQT